MIPPLEKKYDAQFKVVFDAIRKLKNVLQSFLVRLDLHKWLLAAFEAAIHPPASPRPETSRTTPFIRGITGITVVLLNRLGGGFGQSRQSLSYFASIDSINALAAW